MLQLVNKVQHTAFVLASNKCEIYNRFLIFTNKRLSMLFLSDTPYFNHQHFYLMCLRRYLYRVPTLYINMFPYTGWLERIALMSFDLSVLGNISMAIGRRKHVDRFLATFEKSEGIYLLQSAILS